LEGTPIWFGFGNLGLTEDDFVEISYKAGVALIIAAFLVLPTMVLTIACPWRVLHKNALFLVLSMITVHGPSFGISFFSFEFPSLIGGMVGCFLTAGLIQFRVGLRDYVPPVEGDHARDPLAIDTISDNHSIVSSHRKRKQQEKDEKSKVNGDSHVVPIASLQSVPEEVSAQFSRGFKQQQSSISAASEGPDEEEAGLDEEEEEEEDKEDLKLFIEECLGPRKSIKEGYIRELFGRTFPLWGTVVLLVITRLPQIPVKGWLTQQEPAFTIFFGTYGVFRCSASLVLQLRDILTYPNLNWKYELLYIPFIMPFVIVSGITMIIYRKDLQAKPHEILCTVAGRLYNPAIALMGALVLVQLMINSGKAAPANIIGVVLSDALKGGFIAISAFLGALGSFFSGSTTVSNLTFGAIQLIAAQNIGTSETAMLALQAAGGSAGNGICLNNIIAVCAVVGLNIGEGQIIMRTGLPVFCFCVIATIVMVALFMRFE
jgi:L-lactate permease